MTITEPADKRRHSFRWRLTTMLAAAFAFAITFSLGDAIADKASSGGRSIVQATLILFLLQAACILFALGYDDIRSRLKLPRFSLYRPWWRLRLRIRRRWIGSRKKQDYRRAEAALAWPLILVSAIILLALIPWDLAINVLLAAIVIFVIASIASHYRSAPDNPVGSTGGAAVFGLILGFGLNLL